MPRARLTDPETGRTIVISFEGEPPTQEEAQRIIRAVIRPNDELLPTAAGGIGSLVGGAIGNVPGAIAGAGLGGVVGEGIRQLRAPQEVGLPDRRFRIESTPSTSMFGLVEREGTPNTPGEVIRGLASQGAEEMVLDSTGALVSKGLKLAGRGMQRIALRPRGDVLKRNPMVTRDSLEMGLSPESVSHHRRALDLRNRSSQAADELVRSAQQAEPSARINLDHIASDTLDELGESFARRDRTLGTRSTDELLRRLEEFSQRPSVVTLEEAREILSDLNRGADTAFTAARSGDQAAQVSADVSRSLGSGVRRPLEDVVPGLRSQNLNTQRIGTVADALNDTLGGSPVTQMGLGFVGGGTLGTAFGRPVEGALLGTAMLGLTTPSVTSRIGRGLYQAGRVPFANAARAVSIGTQGQLPEGLDETAAARLDELNLLRTELLKQFGGADQLATALSAPRR